jgi:transposase-like protein
MPKKRHKPEQIIGKLRDADAMLAAGKTIGQVCQALEVSEQTFHRWRAQYGGMKAEEAKRLKHSASAKSFFNSDLRQLRYELSVVR